MSKFSMEEKVRIALDGMRCPEGVAELCRQVGISRRNGKTDSQRARLIQENQRLKDLVANLSVDNLVLKKRLMGG